jgi:hypothetical protein
MSGEAVDTRGERSDVDKMSTTIEIRDVPDELLRRLEARAAKVGLSLSDYLLQEILQVAEQPIPKERPPLKELLERIKRRPRVELGESAADAVRAIRGPLKS